MDNSFAGFSNKPDKEKMVWLLFAAIVGFAIGLVSQIILVPIFSGFFFVQILFGGIGVIAALVGIYYTGAAVAENDNKKLSGLEIGVAGCGFLLAIFFTIIGIGILIIGYVKKQQLLKEQIKK